MERFNNIGDYYRKNIMPKYLLIDKHLKNDSKFGLMFQHGRLTWPQ
jgi:hypothetical protein